MSELEREWIERCKNKDGNFIIIVDNDAAYVVDLTDGDCGNCVFEFNHYGWELALDLFKHLLLIHRRENDQCCMSISGGVVAV